MSRWFRKLGTEKINFYNFIATLSTVVVVTGTLGTYVWYDATNKAETRKDISALYLRTNVTDSLLMINIKEHIVMLSALRKDSSNIRKLDIKKLDKEFINPTHFPLGYLGPIDPNNPNTYIVINNDEDYKLFSPFLERGYN